MCTYLTKRGSTYYFRRVIPAELRPAFAGRGEFMVSLRTKDREAAKRLIAPHTIESERRLGEAQAVLGGRPPHSLGAPAAVSPWLTQYAQERAEEGRAEDAAQEARWEARAPLRAMLEKAFLRSTAEITREEAAMRDILRDREYELTIAAEGRLARRVTQAAAVRGVYPAKAAGSGDVAIARVTALGPDVESAAMLDTTIIDLWSAERKVEPKGRDTHRAVACWLYERIGRKPVAEITKREVLAFKAALVAEGQSLANIKMKLSRLRTLLQWAADNDYAPENVAAGVTVKDTDAAKNKRREFDLASLTAIFSSPVFAEGQRPVPGKGEAAYWLPLLALFTGARMEELGQLRPSDVADTPYPGADGEDRSAWFIHITEDEADGLKIKNAGSQRLIPVHPQLEALGFITVVAAAKANGDARLFPSLKPNVYGRLSAKWGEWFSGYLRKVCTVTDKRMVFHSFRHTFKHYARHAGIIEGVQRQLMGHGSGDVADDYGSGYSLHQLVEGVKLYRVPGLSLGASMSSMGRNQR